MPETHGMCPMAGTSAMKGHVIERAYAPGKDIKLA